MKFKFWPKKKKNDISNTSQSDQNIDDKILKDVEFYAMPHKFTVASENNIKSTKKWGMVIIIIDALLLIISVGFLIWYMTQPLKDNNQSLNNTPESQNTNTNNNTEADSNPNEEQENNDNIADTNPVRDFSDKACGETDLYASDSSKNNQVLSCIGERIASDCLRASAMINSDDANALRLAVLGLRQDECLVQLTYPAANNIKNDDWQKYANSYLRCSYKQSDIENLNYQSVDLANYIYQQMLVDNLMDDISCEGTTFTLWQDSQQTSQQNTSKFMPGVDTDQDGLSDVEENSVFTTSINKLDTDTDNYADNTEVWNLYNPIGAGLLKDSGLVNVYKNKTYQYSILYPKNWRLEDETNGDNVMFFSNIEGFIQIITQVNNNNQSLAQWYAGMNNLSETMDLTVLTTTSGLEVLYSPDGLTAYVLDLHNKKNIYVITYSPGQNNKLDFIGTFKMMVNSLTIE